MRAINHALTGAVIGVTVSQPALALPLAFASHFVVDAIPHHAAKNDDWHAPIFAKMLWLDAILCFLLVVILAIWRPESWLQACVCAFLATSPDLLRINEYRRELNNQKQPKKNLLLRLHYWVQWFEKPIGGVVEVAWFIGMSVILYLLCRTV